MSISELIHLIKPPDKPVDALDNGQWKNAQESIGIELPDDFREIGKHYGSGAFCEFLRIMNPLSSNFSASVHYLLTVLRQKKISRNYSYGVYPDQFGLIPFGGDDHGHLLHWLTQGDSDNWPIVLESHEGDFEKFDLSLTVFLSKVFTNRIRPRYIWNQPFTNEELSFVPDQIKQKKRK